MRRFFGMGPLDGLRYVSYYCNGSRFRAVIAAPSAVFSRPGNLDGHNR